MYNVILILGVFFVFCSVIYMYRYLIFCIVLKYYCISFNMYIIYKNEWDKISCKVFSVEL